MVGSAQVQSLNIKHIRQDAIIAVLLTASGISLLSYLLPFAPNLKWIAFASGCAAVVVAVYLHWFFNDLEKQRSLFAWEQWLHSQPHSAVLLDANKNRISHHYAFALQFENTDDLTTYEWLHLAGLEFDAIESVLDLLDDTEGPLSIPLNDSQFMSVQRICDYQNQLCGYVLQLVPKLVHFLELEASSPILEDQNSQDAETQLQSLQEELLEQQQEKINELIGLGRQAKQERDQIESELANLCQGIMTHCLYLDQDKIPELPPLKGNPHPLIEKTHHHVANVFHTLQRLKDDSDHFQNLLNTPTLIEQQPNQSPLHYIYILSQSLYRNSQELSHHNQANRQIFEKLQKHFSDSQDHWEAFYQVFTKGFEQSHKIQWQNLKFAETATLNLQIFHAQRTLIRALLKSNNPRMIAAGLEKLGELGVRARTHAQSMLAASQQLKQHLQGLHQTMQFQSQAMHIQSKDRFKHSALVDVLKIQTDQITTRLENIRSIESKINDKCQAIGLNAPALSTQSTNAFDDVFITTKKDEDTPVSKSA